MKRIILAALAMSAFAATANVPTASAASLSFNFGNVATGYSDGYYDNGHRWHAWRRGEMARYRAQHSDHYSNWRHNDRRHH